MYLKLYIFSLSFSYPKRSAWFLFRNMLHLNHHSAEMAGIICSNFPQPRYSHYIEYWHTVFMPRLYKVSVSSLHFIFREQNIYLTRSAWFLCQRRLVQCWSQCYRFFPKPRSPRSVCLRTTRHYSRPNACCQLVIAMDFERGLTQDREFRPFSKVGLVSSVTLVCSCTKKPSNFPNSSPR